MTGKDAETAITSETKRLACRDAKKHSDGDWQSWLKGGIGMKWLERRNTGRFEICLFSPLAATILLSLAPAAAASELKLSRSDEFVVVAEVNGEKLRLRVDPAANGVIVLNRSAAERARLKEGPLNKEALARIGLAPAQAAALTSDDKPVLGSSAQRTSQQATNVKTFAQLGPLRAWSRFTVEEVRISGKRDAKLLTWFDEDVVNGVDGVISPAELPYDSVTLELGEPRGAEKNFEFSLVYHPLSGFTYRLPVQGRDVVVKFSIWEDSTLATAAAGAVIADTHRGRWNGESRPHPIAMSVHRPVRPLVLGKPLSLGGFKLANFLVRHSDHRGDYALPSDVSTDPDEIIVTGYKDKQPARFTLTLGRDALSTCSRITYTHSSKRLSMRCLANGAAGAGNAS
jgi:hypothetical protein